MCDCIDKNNEFLASHCLELDLPSAGDGYPVRPQVKIRAKTGKKSSLILVGLVAVFCPWCGVRYQETENEHL